MHTVRTQLQQSLNSWRRIRRRQSRLMPIIIAVCICFICICTILRVSFVFSTNLLHRTCILYWYTLISIRSNVGHWLNIHSFCAAVSQRDLFKTLFRGVRSTTADSLSSSVWPSIRHCFLQPPLWNSMVSFIKNWTVSYGVFSRWIWLSCLTLFFQPISEKKKKPEGTRSVSFNCNWLTNDNISCQKRWVPMSLSLISAIWKLSCRWAGTGLTCCAEGRLTVQ